MNIAGVVILYNPEEGLVLRINSYKNGLKKLMIIDNSEIEANSEFLKSWSKEGIQYIYDNNNAGIAQRLNQAAQIAITENYDWLLTMDQDSYFKNEEFTYYLNCLNIYNEKEKVAQFGVSYEKTTTGEPSCLSKKVSKLITSGSIINIKTYNEVGKFDENLFIDGVDTEYCLRANIKGYFNVQYYTIQLQHSIGSQSYHRSFKNFKKTSRSLHSPVRLYYMTRNFLYIRTLQK